MHSTLQFCFVNYICAYPAQQEASLKICFVPVDARRNKNPLQIELRRNAIKEKQQNKKPSTGK